MRRARLAAELRGDSLNVHERAGVGRVELGGLRVKHQVGAGPLDEFDVGVEVARVGGQILVRGELDGVQKHAYHHAVALGDGAFDEAFVPLVEISHRGDEADGEPFGLPFADNVFRLFDGCCDIHKDAFFLGVGLVKLRHGVVA